MKLVKKYFFGVRFIVVVLVGILALIGCGGKKKKAALWPLALVGSGNATTGGGANSTASAGNGVNSGGETGGNGTGTGSGNMTGNGGTGNGSTTGGADSGTGSGDSVGNNAGNIEDLPSKPSSLQATAIGRTQIDIAWSPSVSSKVAQNSLVYEICRSKIQGGCNSFVAGSVTTAGVSTYNVINLSTGTHFFRIRARDSFNRLSETSNEVSATTAWLDPTDDTRTDINSPETAADIRKMDITADSANLNLIFTMGDINSGSKPQLQIAIDTDQIVSSGGTFFTGFADTEVSPNAAWEKLIQTRFGSGNSTASVMDTSFNPISCNAANSMDLGSNTISISIPWSCLGSNGIPAYPVRFTIASFRSQNNDLTIDIGGPNFSNALDVIGPACSSSCPNTYWDVENKVVNYYFDIQKW